MNRIAIVGHPSSRYQDVLALLQESGMAAAQPSRREGLLPQEINATLIKAHDAPTVSAVLDEDGFAPLETGPVWHGMALDLMLGNLEQPLWGWADPHAIFALDYWKELDPQLTFVLVYDEPHRVLMDASIQGGEQLSAQDVNRLLDNWTAYNGALLRFYLRHPARSVLVHAEQARRAAGGHLQRLQVLLDTPLSLPELHSDSEPEIAGLAAPATSVLPAVLNEAVAAAGAEPERAAAILAASAAERYVVDGVLVNHRRALQLHAELQSAASVPLERQFTAAESAAVAWENLLSQRYFLTNLLARIYAKYQDTSKELSLIRNRLEDARSAQATESKRLSGELQQVQQALEAEKAKASQRQKELEAQKAKASQQQKEREKISAQYDKKLQDVGSENELLLTQLHRVQEELERAFQLKQEIEQREASNDARSKAAAEQAKERIKSLVQRLKNAKELIKSESAQEAERVKQHIAYRLGELVLRHGRTPWGWLILPFAVMQVARGYRKQRREMAG